MASVLLNGSPTSEFQFHCGLKQGDPLPPYLFILVMESLHLSLFRAIKAGIFKGIKIGSSLNISHLFYADDAVFIGEWSIANLSGITHILHCFSLLFGLLINLKKSHLLGFGIRSEDVNAAALYFGCSTMKTPFKYGGWLDVLAVLLAWDHDTDWLKLRVVYYWITLKYLYGWRFPKSGVVTNDGVHSRNFQWCSNAREENSVDQMGKWRVPSFLFFYDPLLLSSVGRFLRNCSSVAIALTDIVRLVDTSPSESPRGLHFLLYRAFESVGFNNSVDNYYCKRNSAKGTSVLSPQSLPKSITQARNTSFTVSIVPLLDHQFQDVAWTTLHFSGLIRFIGAAQGSAGNKIITEFKLAWVGGSPGNSSGNTWEESGYQATSSDNRNIF
ncbi:RNA-directed DNA polymerase, eukaryota [Tanacetum coccineum]